MIKRQDFTNFTNKLVETQRTYLDKIDEMESHDMDYSDRITVSIWSDRVDAIEHMLHELDMLEFELYT